ncbi:MAG: sensor histidine kinase [Ktedonobacteraceae bacterium]|nr:sensor histidine kinase [Ktedonobacteraceae bacterium]
MRWCCTVPLISNALQYSPASTTVRVEVTGDAEEALLSVHNDGSSLSLEQQEHLFEPFYRGPKLWCSATLGWGLGLTISKHLVEQQGDASGWSPQSSRGLPSLSPCLLTRERERERSSERMALEQEPVQEELPVASCKASYHHCQPIEEACALRKCRRTHHAEQGVCEESANEPRERNKSRSKQRA